MTMSMRMIRWRGGDRSKLVKVTMTDGVGGAASLTGGATLNHHGAEPLPRGAQNAE
jgi:hypothetical protein